MWTVPSHRLIIDGGSYASAIEYLAADGLKKFTSHEKKNPNPKQTMPLKNWRKKVQVPHPKLGPKLAQQCTPDREHV